MGTLKNLQKGFTVYECLSALSLMIAFGLLVATILNGKKK